jgi:hypothetical protein
MARVVSAMGIDYIWNKPGPVKRWEKDANLAGSDEEAVAQLVFHLLVQTRMIKLVLIWTLVVVPVVLFVLGIVLVNAATPDSPSGF